LLSSEDRLASQIGRECTIVPSAVYQGEKERSS
jgi:hypothetical protein